MAKTYYSFMIDPELAECLKRVKAHDGISESEQIRRALRDWFRRKGIEPKPLRSSDRPKE